METQTGDFFVPRHSTTDRLREDLLFDPGSPIRPFNEALHATVRDLVNRMNREYLAARFALGEAYGDRSVLGLILVYEPTFESNTNLELGYIRWRSGSSKVNKSRASKGARPITRRVPKHRNALHYSASDFSRVHNWHRAPHWEKRLVMLTETKIRPLRDALRAHEKAQRAYLFSPPIPELDFSFSPVED